MAIISMLFLFVKQLAFICRTFIEDDQRVCSLSQVFPHVLDPPLAAHMGEPNQVQCCTSIEDD